jgi:hypothetical protein
VAPALIVADQHGADLEVALGWAGAAAPGKAVQEFERGTVECAKRLFLNPLAIIRRNRSAVRCSGGGLRCAKVI